MANAAIAFSVLFVVLPGCNSIKSPWPALQDQCFISKCSAEDVEASETVEAISLLQTSATVSAIQAVSTTQTSQSIPAVIHKGSNAVVPPKRHVLQHDLQSTAPQRVMHKDEPLQQESTVIAPPLALICVLNFVWLWSPFLIAAAVCSYMRQQSQASDAKHQFGDTSALTGLRVLLALWVMLEHAGLHRVAGNGPFIVLSGAVLSTSRRVSPGVSFNPVDSFSSYFRFMFLRAAPILPMFWFSEVAVGMLPVYWLTTLANNKIPEPTEYFRFLPLSFEKAWAERTSQMMLTAAVPQLGHYWFVRTILVVYLFYPLLERLALGPKNLQPANSLRLYAWFATCCLAKLAVGLTMCWIFEQSGYPLWYAWRGISLYGNPILRLPEFMLGVLVSHLAAPEDTSALTAWVPVCSDVLLCVMVITGLVLPQNSMAELLTNMNIQAPLVAFVMWGLCYGPKQSPLARLLFSRPWLVTAGEWMYGFYLFHPHILLLTHGWGYLPGTGWAPVQEMFLNHEWEKLASHMACVLAATVISLLMSWSTFVLVERPLRQCARWVVGKGSKSS